MTGLSPPLSPHPVSGQRGSLSAGAEAESPTPTLRPRPVRTDKQDSPPHVQQSESRPSSHSVLSVGSHPVHPILKGNKYGTVQELRSTFSQIKSNIVLLVCMWTCECVFGLLSLYRDG